MTNRIPLIVNPSDGQIQELAVTDQLNLGTSNIINVGNITANYFIGDGSQLTNIPGGTSEGDFTITAVDFAAASGSRYGVNTASGIINATLPGAPATGDAIYFAQAGGDFAVNNLIINPLTNTIMNAVGNLNVNITNQSFGLFYNGATWRIYI